MTRHMTLARRRGTCGVGLTLIELLVVLGITAALVAVALPSMNEFIARAYPFRLDPNGNYARTEFSLAAGEEEFTAEAAFPRSNLGLLARGDLEPLLGLPLLKPRRAG